MVQEVIRTTWVPVCFSPLGVGMFSSANLLVQVPRANHEPRQGGTRSCCPKSNQSGYSPYSDSCTSALSLWGVSVLGSCPGVVPAFVPTSVSAACPETHGPSTIDAFLLDSEFCLPHNYALLGPSCMPAVLLGSEHLWRGCLSTLLYLP